MPMTSAGVLLYRRPKQLLELLLVHPGGPFWSRKDVGAWTIPKGEIEAGEDPLACALREFAEETGVVPSGEAVDLGVVRQAGGKTVRAFAIEGDCDPAALTSNTFDMEWPPHSGKTRSFPEIEKADWFTPSLAREKINPAQAEFVTRLELRLGPPKSQR